MPAIKISPINLAICIFSAIVVVFGCVGISGKQFEVYVRPSPLAPNYHCLVTLHFYNRRAECPGKPTTNVMTPRHEGFFGCPEAWDKFQTAFGTAVIALAFATATMFYSAYAAFVAPTAATYKIRSIVMAVLAAFPFVFYLISWPIVQSLFTEDQCGHQLKGFTMTTFTKVLVPSFGYGHAILITAWCVSVAPLVAAIVGVVTAAKPEDDGEEVSSNAPDQDEDELKKISPVEQPPVVYDDAGAAPRTVDTVAV